MVRYAIDGSPISIGYGFDHIGGIFLSVMDDRLKYDENATDDVNQVFNGCETLNLALQDGGGCYLDFHTAYGGFGLKVSMNVMAVYLKRYGAPDNHIAELLKLAGCSGNGVTNKQNSSKIVSKSDFVVDTFLVNHCCSVCLGRSGSACAKCHIKNYCGRDCQVNDWGRHKHFCNLVFPPIKRNQNSVFGILLPENDVIPLIVEIPFKTVREDDENYVYPDPQLLFGRHIFVKSSFMFSNKLRGLEKLPNALTFKFNDNFMNDGSKVNKCIESITKGKADLNWRGPIIVTRIKKEGYCPPHVYYEDIKMDDTSHIVDYLLFSRSGRL